MVRSNGPVRALHGNRARQRDAVARLFAGDRLAAPRVVPAARLAAPRAVPDARLAAPRVVPEPRLAALRVADGARLAGVGGADGARSAGPPFVPERLEERPLRLTAARPLRRASSTTDAAAS